MRSRDAEVAAGGRGPVRVPRWDRRSGHRRLSMDHRLLTWALPVRLDGLPGVVSSLQIIVTDEPRRRLPYEGARYRGYRCDWRPRDPGSDRRGASVSALVRTPEKAAALTKQGAKAVSVSIFDRSALTAVIAGHDAIANLTSAIPPVAQLMRAKAWRDNDRVHTEGSTAVVDAALAAGVGRVVQESVSMLYPD
jgi:putative NAD(P)-binding protein